MGLMEIYTYKHFDEKRIKSGCENRLTQELCSQSFLKNKMKRHQIDDDLASKPEEGVSTSKVRRIEESDILQDLENNLNLPDSHALNQQLLETQKQFFALRMEKLMHSLPNGKAVVEVIERNGQTGDFMYMYTASKTIIQSLLNIKQSKAINSVVDMMAGIMCQYVHERVITPMFESIIHKNHLKRAIQAYQNSVKVENDAEVEMRCLLHCIHGVLETAEDHQCIKLVHPVQAQITNHMKAMSEYVVALLVSVAEPVKIPERKMAETIVLHAAEVASTSSISEDIVTE